MIMHAFNPSSSLRHAFPVILAAGLMNLQLAGQVDLTYQNPVTDPSAGADPAVLYHEGTFYAYTTNSKGVVQISNDLVNWKEGPQVIPDHLKGAWAPEVYHHPEDGKFYMYYTSRYKIGVAVADRPDELFHDLGFIAIPGIDAHPFRDDDGRLYLYFTHTPEFSMYCIPMKSPIEPGGPVTRSFEISQDWERHSFPINEGPWMIKHNGTYYLFYSGSNGQSVYYSVGYATAPTPLGPFTKYPDNPVIRHTDEIWGPGHGSFTMDRNGQWWHLYHQKTDTKIGWRRFICLDSLEIDKETGKMWGIPTKGKEQSVPEFGAAVTWVPEFHPRGDYFYESVEVALSSRTPEAVIHYTLDGSEPTRSSARFETPFSIDRTTTVKARSFADGMQESRAVEMVFTRTNWKLEATEFTEVPSGDPPFRVYPSPVLTLPPKQNP